MANALRLRLSIQFCKDWCDQNYMSKQPVFNFSKFINARPRYLYIRTGHIVLLFVKIIANLLNRRQESV